MSLLGEHKLIFEGVELAGKSFLIHQIYDLIEKKYNKSKHILDGCHWFNSDIGVFGTEFGKPMVDLYVKMAELLERKNVIFEKLHISDQAYNQFHNKLSVNYEEAEDKLEKLGAKIILCVVKPDKELFEFRLKNRLTQSPHYYRIAKSPEEYIRLQENYIEKCAKSKLPVLKVDLTKLPNSEAIDQILRWIGEK